MSIYGYWIGRDVNLDEVWRDYENGVAYEQKFRKITCHLIEIEFDVPPPGDRTLFTGHCPYSPILAIGGREEMGLNGLWPTSGSR